MSDDINIETDNLENGVYWITPSTLGNPSGSYGRLVKMDNYKMFVSAIATSGIYYARELWVSIYVNSTWTSFNCFSDDATVIESAIKNYQVEPQEADSPFNIPLGIGAYIVSLSQYGTWANTVAMYIVFLSNYSQSAYIEKITSQALADTYDVQIGDDCKSIDVYNTAAPTMKVSVFKVGTSSQ